MDAKSKKLAILAVVLVVAAIGAYFFMSSRGGATVPTEVRNAAAQGEKQYAEEAAKTGEPAPPANPPSFSRKAQPAK